MVCQMRVTKIVSVDSPNLPALIKEARLKIEGRSITDLSSAAKMTTANWYQIESGNRKEIPVDTLRAIENALGVSFGVEI
jgi:DNA-binding Xre family transcriptional regulator